MDQSTVISDKKGKITLSNLSPKTYTIHIVDGNKWTYGKGRPIEFNMGRNQKQVLPMIQTVPVEGQVIALPNKYTRTLPSLEGIRIVATDADGQQLYTLTDDMGHFQFYLPKKQFTISLDTKGLTFSGSESSMYKIQVSDASMPKILFKIIDQSRKVDVQQF